MSIPYICCDPGWAGTTHSHTQRSITSFSTIYSGIKVWRWEFFSFKALWILVRNSKWKGESIITKESARMVFPKPRWCRRVWRPCASVSTRAPPPPGLSLGAPFGIRSDGGDSAGPTPSCLEIMAGAQHLALTRILREAGMQPWRTLRRAGA